jgi:LacI family transcriptional regulator
MASAYLQPSSPFAAAERKAAEVLFRRLDGDRSPSEHHVVRTRMIVRGSGEIPA